MKREPGCQNPGPPPVEYLPSFYSAAAAACSTSCWLCDSSSGLTSMELPPSSSMSSASEPDCTTLVWLWVLPVLAAPCTAALWLELSPELVTVNDWLTSPLSASCSLSWLTLVVEELSSPSLFLGSEPPPPSLFADSSSSLSVFATPLSLFASSNRSASSLVSTSR